VDVTTIIRIVAGIVFLGVLAIGIAYIAFLSGLLAKCSPAARTMQPGMVWLMLVPLFNLIWSFIVVNALSESLAKEFGLRKLPLLEPKPGKPVGIAMAVSGACSIIPLVNLLAMPAHLILWIMYWVKMAGYSRCLEQVATGIGV
jgi:hypothetical protein